MSEKPNKFYITTPIYYVNARPHIGHAYTTIAADVLARRHRLLGDDTFFLTGTDEHGQKIERSAAAAGIPPQQFADEVSASFENLWKRMGITNDKFIRTTSPAHVAGVQKLFSKLYASGHIYLDTYTGAYCVSDETFVDVPAGAPCPDCGRVTETVTEENFFFRLSAFQRPLLDLIETGALAVEPESRRNEVLSFLRGNTAAATDFTPDTGIQPDAKYGATAPEHQLHGLDEGSSPAPDAPPTLRHSDSGKPYVPGALKDLSVSRSSFTWGVPVPDPAASTAAQKHVIYVWLDALANYMTAIGYGSDAPIDEAEFKKYWPADLHLVGKEIIRFHCVYWPAFLLAAGLPLPKAITAHGWLLFDNSKMSKSKGNIVRTETILDAFGTLCPATPTKSLPLISASTGLQPGAGGSSGLQATESTSALNRALAPEANEPTKADRDLFAADILRYFLLREIPFGQDGSFSFEAMITRYNADLANGYGNLVSRTLSMIEKYFEGVIPKPTSSIPDEEYQGIIPELNKRDEYFFHPNSLLKFGLGLITQVERSYSREDFAVALNDLWSFPTTTDSVISAARPWKRSLSDDREHGIVATTLYFAAESIRVFTATLYPYLPYATARVWAQLGLGSIEQAASEGKLKNLQWGGLQPGTKLGPLGPIFPRADKGLAQIMADIENPSPLPPETLAPQQVTRPEAPLKQALTPAHAQPVAQDPTSPAAPPRSLDEPSGILPVGGSSALSTGPAATPSHTEAAASGIFAGQTPAGPADTTPQITIDDFIKVELRVAQIVLAERIPKADKLLRLEVDLGPDFPRRQILSGIAEWYTPEDLIGRRIVVITNLAPRKMRGLESHGMLLAASNGDNGKPILATFSEDIALGSRLR